MKACVLHAVGDLRYEEAPHPVLEPGQVLLRIKASGICGSDIQRVFEKGTYHFPTIPGHEFAGEIVETGPGADGGLRGKRAAVFPLIPCKKCAACETGQYAQCGNYDYYGSRRDGGFAEYLAVNQFNLVPVPDSVSDEEAAMCEPAAVAVHAFLRAGAVLGDTVAVFGAGAIGIILAKIAVISGTGNVILIDIDEKKLDFAKSLGFEHCFHGREAEERISELTQGKGPGVVFEGTGAASALAQCFRCAGVFGTVVLMGNPAGEMRIDQKSYWEILRKQLVLKGTWNSSFCESADDWKGAMDLMPRLGLPRLITHRYPLSACGEAFSMLKNRSEFAVKAMFTENGTEEMQ